MELFLQLTDWADRFTIWAALATFMVSLKMWLSGRKQNDRITIRLQAQNASEPPIDLPMTLKRRDCTRAEILGILGCACKKDRFDIPYIKTDKFYEALEKIQSGKDKVLIIHLDDEAQLADFRS